MSVLGDDFVDFLEDFFGDVADVVADGFVC